VTDDQLSALRGRLLLLRSDLLTGQVKEFSAGELNLLAQTQAALIAVDEHRDDIRSPANASGDPGRQ
jgi:hypothetical protein